VRKILRTWYNGAMSGPKADNGVGAVFIGWIIAGIILAVFLL